jgi:hypothetical protein
MCIRRRRECTSRTPSRRKRPDRARRQPPPGLNPSPTCAFRWLYHRWSRRSHGCPPSVCMQPPLSRALIPRNPRVPPPRSWARNAARHGGLVGVQDPHAPGAPSHTYAELHQLIQDCGAGLKSLGLEPGERVRPCAARCSSMGGGLREWAGGPKGSVDERNWVCWPHLALPHLPLPMLTGVPVL